MLEQPFTAGLTLQQRCVTLGTVKCCIYTRSYQYTTQDAYTAAAALACGWNVVWHAHIVGLRCLIGTCMACMSSGNFSIGI